MSATATAYERLVDDLRSNGRQVIENGDGSAKAQCPVTGHGAGNGDLNPSLSIKKIPDRVLMKCWAGCDNVDIMKHLGRSMADLFDDKKGCGYRYPGGRIVRRKANADGSKKIWQEGNKEDTSLFHSDKIGDATHVYVVEGEQDVLTVESLGGKAVTSAMGAGNAHLSNWNTLEGKDVTIIIDRDTSGTDYAREVMKLLKGIAASVKVVAPKVEADKADATDHIMAGGKLDDFIEIDLAEDQDGGQDAAEKVEIPDGADLLDMVEDWYGRFISCEQEDREILTLWTAHTHLAAECYTTPRLLLDSAMPGSGKTTVCEHIKRLGCNAVHFASLSSTALLVRILQDGIRTLLIDEVDRTLSPDKSGVGELTAVLNSGYKVGATRPVLMPQKGGGWKHEEMPTFAPVVLSGNSPRLADDTRSRCIRILLMPDIEGLIEDSDWEYIEDEAKKLHGIIAAWAESVRDHIKELKVDLPDGCRSRSREKWRPLKRVAVAAGGDWPEKVDKLIVRDLAEEAADRADGLRSLPPAVVLMTDLHEIWSKEGGFFWNQVFVGTKELVNRLAFHNPEQWGEFSAYGKRLTETRLGRMITQIGKVHSTRIDHNGIRGYRRADLEPAWHRLGIGR